LFSFLFIVLFTIAKKTVEVFVTHHSPAFLGMMSVLVGKDVALQNNQDNPDEPFIVVLHSFHQNY